MERLEEYAQEESPATKTGNLPIKPVRSRIPDKLAIAK